MDPDAKPSMMTEVGTTLEQPLKGNSVLRVSWIWTHGSYLDHDYNPNAPLSSFVWEMVNGHGPAEGARALLALPSKTLIRQPRSSLTTTQSMATSPGTKRTAGRMTMSSRSTTSGGSTTALLTRFTMTTTGRFVLVKTAPATVQPRTPRIILASAPSRRALPPLTRYKLLQFRLPVPQARRPTRIATN